MTKEFKKAIEYAMADFEQDYVCRCQVWSFAFYKGAAISIGKNDAKTHPLNRINKLTFHSGGVHFDKGSCAELKNFLRLKKRTNIPFSKIDIVNVRIDKNLIIKNSRPCLSCQSLFRYLNPRSVYHTTDNGDFAEYTV